MKFIKIDPLESPPKAGESWYLVHPNNPNCEFKVPGSGAVTLCLNEYLCFDAGKVYSITDVDNTFGWLSVVSSEMIVRMPFYLFARHFDAECFVKRYDSPRSPAPYLKYTKFED